MRIGVWANDGQWEEINKGIVGVEYARLVSFENITDEADAYLLLKDERFFNFEITSKPIFINAVCYTLKEMHAPPNVLRINGWYGFLARNTWEISGSIDEPVLQVCTAIGKTIIPVPDEPGLISARIIAMIINEAYLVLEENISTRDEIDLSMKLGTNYPYGPFEWAALIGEEKIYKLLQKLCEQDKRYLPATQLKASFTQ
jgi:3-hydroxybutyryl-CoA dehydrogenase